MAVYQDEGFGALMEDVIVRLEYFGVVAQVYDDKFDPKRGLRITLSVETNVEDFNFDPYGKTEDTSDVWVGISERDDVKPVITTVAFDEKDRNIIAAGIYYALLNRGLLAADHDKGMNEEFDRLENETDNDE